MSQLLHLAGPDGLERLLPMVAAYHEFEGIETTEDHRREAIAPLLDGSPHGAIWFVGPKMAPVGYIAVSFGWSIELGGMDGFIDEFWIREKVRGRGMGTEVLAALLATLKDAGVQALHLEVAKSNEDAQRIYSRAGFSLRPYGLMTWTAKG
ncbi:MAG: GNAT family N-acetyltransferase [Boseongicola sp.]|nr:GNAT family N-acetyltransferase [Boseongicola sp.]MDD9976456.1 GNAT family N-acetyltransferase [Boseongicola sp.]